MKKKQMLAMLLAALMTLSVPLVAFAEGEPTDPNTADLIQPCIADDKAPLLKSITLSSETVNAGDTLTITVDAEDDLSGIKECYVSFENKNTKKSLHVSHFMAESKELTLEIPKYEPDGKYDLTVVCLKDNTGNVVWYAKDTNMNFSDNSEVKPLSFDLSFTVINDGSVTTPPTNPDKPVTPPTDPDKPVTPPTNPDKPVTPPTNPDKPVTPPTNPDKPVTSPAPEQKPFQPSYSTGSSASGSSVTSVKSAPAASGSSIKQEEKDRLFWKNKQDQIRKAANGKKIRIFIPKETTRVPASFLESIRTAENDITVELRWNGKKITITPETALKRSPRRVFWNLKTLLEYYHA